MSQAQRWVDTHTWPIYTLPADVIEAIQGAVVLSPPPGVETRGRFPDGSEVWKVDGKFIAKEATGT